MPSVNKVILIGHVGKIPDIKFLPSGTQIASFSLATNERYKKDNGYEEKTEWHSIKAFGKLSDIIAEFVIPGMPLYVEGRLQTSNWEDKNGQRHYKTEIIANSIQLLAKKEEKQAEPIKNEPVENKSEEDDLPF